MELVLALLLAASLVALASTWSALRTERARAHRVADRLAVGSVSNMYEIAGSLAEARVVSP